jgi:hypothetical protein
LYTPTSLPQPIVTPFAIASLKARIAFCTRTDRSEPRKPLSKYSAYASSAVSVGKYATPCSFISLKTSSVPPYPCSIVSTPASVARRIPSAVVACAATGRPALCASSTSVFNSSSVNVGVAGRPPRP